MYRRFSARYALLSIILDGVAVFAALWLATRLRPLIPETAISRMVATVHIPAGLSIAAPLLWLILLGALSIYNLEQIPRAVDEFFSVAMGSVLASLAFAGLLYLTVRDVPRWLFLIFSLLSLVLLLGWRVVLRFALKVGRLPFDARRVLIVGAGETGRQVGETIAQYHWTGIELAGYLDDLPTPEKAAALDAPLFGSLDEVETVVTCHKIDDVIVALPQKAYEKLSQLVFTLHDRSVEVHVVPDYFTLSVNRAHAENFGGLPLINLQDLALSETERVAKRLLDLAVAGSALLLLAPLILLIALLIRLDSPGPVLFRQERVGENGALFTMLKFRTMVENAPDRQTAVNHVDENGDLIHKTPDDPRVTRVGHYLRRTSLDELPQLFNVLKSEMSVVGPRPELPWLVDQYQPWQRKRFSVPQGMTGWWQVNGRSDRPLHLNTEDDLYYIRHYSLWLDLYILLKTPLVILRGRGAY